MVGVDSYDVVGLTIQPVEGITIEMSILTLRERIGIDKQNYPMVSRIIKDALIVGKIKVEKTENQRRNNKGYVPFWE
mgnify:CR=1 FL=1